MLHRYETLILTVPEVTKDETKNLEREMDKLIQSAKGNIISFEQWGKFRLAYPVNKNDYGVYFFTRFEMPENSSIVEDIRMYFVVKLNDLVMRSMTSALDPKGSLEYLRPKSLEEAPSRDVDTFLKENKMEGLLSSTGNQSVSKTEKEALGEQEDDQKDFSKKTA